MENRTINLGVVAEVASALKEIKDQVVFVGGAVVSLYTDDPAADEIRPTKDVDMTLNIVNLSEWVTIQEKLAGMGIHPDPFGHAICSYRYKDIPLDIMSAEDGPLGSANRWFKIGFADLQKVDVHGEEVQILSAPCYLATKFEAYNDRGTNYRTSHDIEDVVYVLDNRTTLVEEVLSADKAIKDYIVQQFKTIKEVGMLDEVLISHIHPIMLAERMPLAHEKINQILADA